MKGYFFGFGSPQQQVDMHARSKKHFPFLITCIYFYLIGSTTFKRFAQRFLLCVMLIGGDWSDWLIKLTIMPVMSDKAAFVSGVLFCVQPLPGNSYFYCSKCEE